MPTIDSPEEKLIAFLQKRLGQEVSVPKHATDVMRVTRFPGLEQPEKSEAPGQLDFYGELQAPQQPQVDLMRGPAPMRPRQETPEFPEGF